MNFEIARVFASLVSSLNIHKAIGGVDDKTFDELTGAIFNVLNPTGAYKELHTYRNVGRIEAIKLRRTRTGESIEQAKNNLEFLDRELS